MKRLISLFALLALVISPTVVLAQSAAPGAAVTQTGATGLAAQKCLSANGTNNSGSPQLTLTVPSPGGGNSIYFDYLVAALSTIAAPASSAGVLNFTSTNIAGTPIFPVSMFGPIVSGGNLIIAAGANGGLAIPIKAQVGTSPTIVGPTANAIYGQIIVACWHEAP